MCAEIYVLFIRIIILSSNFIIQFHGNITYCTITDQSAYYIPLFVCLSKNHPFLKQSYI